MEWGGVGGGLARARPALSPCPAGRAQNVKQLYALVCETQRYAAVLDAVIAGAGLLRAEKLRPQLAKVTGWIGRRGAGRGSGRLLTSYALHRAHCATLVVPME